MPHFEGYVYPNEATQQPLWSILIVLYPYITGLVAGAFIMASLVRVFNVKALEPVYRLSMLTAFAFLLCAPLPLLFHLGHPERCLRGDDDAAPDFADGDLRLCLCVVSDGGAAAGTVVRLPAGLCRVVREHAGLPRHVLSSLHGRGDGRVRRRRSNWITRSATSFRSSAFPRPFCCTATWGSSSGRSRPIRGGATC